MAAPERSGGGRPRDPYIDEAVLSAALSVLSEAGYHGLSLEEVARRAGTSRPAIYRRWPGRTHLALAAIASRLNVPAPPDAGCTLCDLAEGFNVFLSAYRTIRPDVLSSLYADCAADPELRGRYLDTVIEPSRRAVGRTIEKAIARGDLRPDTDASLLLDLVASLVYYRSLFADDHMSDAEAEKAIEALLRGAAVDYDGLLAHAMAAEGHEVPHGHEEG
ncbi:TetR family transcriptional regulator [Phytomonospora endophytica]|nr:TetR family transcriptional regulator [Phytomonospora endophytica]